MKWVVWLLLLLNVVLLGYFQLSAQRRVEPVAGHEAIDADRIKILSPEELAQLPKKEPPPPPEPTPPSPPALCYEWGSFAAADATRARAALDKLGLTSIAKSQTPQEAIRYWVYIPPRKSMEEAQAKVDEIRALGVEESYIIEDPKWRYAISLGVFRDGTLATKFVEELRSRGVKSAVKGQRNLEGGQTGFTITSVTPEQAQEIGKLKPDFPGSELKKVDCH